MRRKHTTHHANRCSCGFSQMWRPSLLPRWLSGQSKLLKPSDLLRMSELLALPGLYEWCSGNIVRWTNHTKKKNTRIQNNFIRSLLVGGLEASELQLASISGKRKKAHSKHHPPNYARPVNAVSHPHRGTDLPQHHPTKARIKVRTRFALQIITPNKQHRNSIKKY